MPASRQFRITTAVYALLVAAAGLLALGGYWLLDITADKIVATQAERTSVGWANYASAQLPRLEEILDGGPITESEREFLRGVRDFGGVFRFKLFDLEGRLRLVFDERGYWLFLTGHRQGDLRRMVRVYGFPQEQVYPSGYYVFGGQYGPYTNIPIPGTERRINPEYTGCINRDA